MKLSLDRTLRIIWLLIGILLLGFLVAGGVMILAQVIGNMGAGEAAVRVANEKSSAPREEPRAIRYGGPQAIRGTTTRLIPVGAGRGYVPERAGYAASGPSRDEFVANIIFLDDQGARLLLDRPAYVGTLTYPQRDEDVQRWIEYTIAFDDTNRDGRLDSRDGLALYVSDLEGRNLRPVLRPPLRLVETEVLDAGRMLVLALEPPPGQQAVDEKRMRQRTFIYDVASGRLTPYAALESAAARAAQILGR
jgi:hypothetical protein